MKIGFFGCSFTEGGGFNSPVYVDYAIKNNIIDISELDDKVKIWGNTEREAYETYGKDYNGPFNSISKKYCYPTMVGKKLNCEVVNFAEVAHLMNILLKSYMKITKTLIFVLLNLHYIQEDINGTRVKKSLNILTK